VVRRVHEDAVLVNLSHREHPLTGRKTIVQTVSRNLERMVTVHHGHMPEIEVIDPGHVHATWSMEDLLFVNDPSKPGFSLHGYGTTTTAMCWKTGGGSSGAS